MKKAAKRTLQIFSFTRLNRKKDKRVLVLFIFAVLILIYLQPIRPASNQPADNNKYVVVDELVFVCTGNDEIKCLPKPAEAFSYKYPNNTSGNMATAPPRLAFFLNEPFAINQATVDELTFLPGIGPKTAEKIVLYRQQYGAFRNIEELMLIDGIGPKTIMKVQDLITLSL